MGRVALVTGASRGLGRAVAKALADGGYTVAANYHSNDEAAASLEAEANVKTFKWDVSDYETSKEGVARIVADLGPVEVLVNNAGISPDKFFHKMTHELWKKVIDTNLNSFFHVTHQVIGPMRDVGFGRIVNMASLSAFGPNYGETSYGAAKGAMISFTKALAKESIAKGITVNAVAPGYCDTDMVNVAPDDWLDNLKANVIPAGRLGTPEEVARCVMFLVAEDAGFITGATIDVNGGQLMR